MATHPTDPRRIAVVYQRYAHGGTCGLDTTLRISHDGGSTWRTATGRPYAGSGRGPNFHAVIAWGPGPRTGSARLYWVDTTVPGCNYGTHALTVSYSDDEGATWSRLYVERRTPPWIGGFPEIAVDREPTSPRHGAVYVVYNWLASRTAGPGMRVIASSDFGRTWRATVDIPPAPRPAGCRASWRIGYRAATGPDGSLFVSGYQADLRHWDADRPFAKGGAANVCRLGVTVTRVRLDARRHRLTAGATVMATLVARSAQAVYGAPAAGTAATTVDPEWCHGLAVDRADGAVYLAVGSYAGTRAHRGAQGDHPRGREPGRWPDLAVADASAGHDPGPARVRRRHRLRPSSRSSRPATAASSWGSTRSPILRARLAGRPWSSGRTSPRPRTGVAPSGSRSERRGPVGGRRARARGQRGGPSRRHRRRGRRARRVRLWGRPARRSVAGRVLRAGPRSSSP